MIEIKRASEEDIPAIEDILADAVAWLDSIGEPMWTAAQVTWEGLSRYFAVSDFYIVYLDGIPVGCMALVDSAGYWREIPKGESLFICKLAVKRSAAGKGVSDALIAYAKSMCADMGIPALRLGCPQERQKLRAVYERKGFVCVGERNVYYDSVNYPTAFYKCDI